MGQLKASERAKLLRGEWPSLTRPFAEGEPPPFQQGEEFVLRRFGGAKQVWLTITNVKRERKGGWKVEYSFADHRPLFLRRGGNLTRVAADSCDPEAPVIDKETQKAWQAKARLESIQRKEDAERRGDHVSELTEANRRKRERVIRDRLRETLAGLEPAAAVALLARIESEIAEFKATTKEAA
jgi:hypothetical protein